jgi:hypothetical protein
MYGRTIFRANKKGVVPRVDQSGPAADARRTLFVLRAACICENGKYSIVNTEIVFIEPHIKLGLSSGKIPTTNGAARRKWTSDHFCRNRIAAEQLFNH